jgi:hypothetical protein
LLARGVAGCRDRQARTDQVDSPDRMEPWLANEQTDTSEANEPTEPTDRIEPADPMDKIDPADPMDRMDPLEPMLRIDPAEPEPEPVSRRVLSLVRMGPFSQPVGKMMTC